MLKRFFLALSLVAGLFSPAIGAGSISLSLSQQFDSLGNPLNGGLFYTYAAGTTTPQSAYQDSALTLPWPNPITMDSAGRLPQLFFADGSIKVRITNSAGVVQLAADGILVVGASSGGGGGSPVDATTVLATGDLKVKYGTGTLSGFVRANGRTIGSSTSGATERANSDTQSLFEYLWTADANLSVSTGRGVSANADWVANKNIALPDWRGRVIAGLDDMGSSSASRLTSSYFGATATVLGAAGGLESHTLTTAQLAAHNHGGVSGAMNSNQSHSHAVSGATVGGTSASGVQGGGTFLGVVTSGPTAITIGATNTDHTHNIAIDGSGQAHNNVQPTMLATIYMKL